MNETWGRTGAAGTWPHPKPVWSLAVCLLAMASGGAIAAYRYHTVWTPLQRVYAPTWLRCQLMVALGFTKTGRYRLLEVDGIAGTRLALDDEVQPGPVGGGPAALALTEAAVRIGGRRLLWRDASYPHAALHTFLERWIYRDRAIADVLRPALWGGLVIAGRRPVGRGAEGYRPRTRPATGPPQGARHVSVAR
jgi:hypothetical protein